MTRSNDRTAPFLKSYVKALGLRQEDFGNLLGITRIHAGRIINLKSGFGIDHAKKFCRYAGFPERDFNRLYDVPADPAYFSKHNVEWKGPKPLEDGVVFVGLSKTINIEVVGAVQAGVFTEALEWDYDKKYEVILPIEDGYPRYLPRYGLEVRGDSMNKVYPAGTLLVVINFDDLGREPKSGEYVVVFRRASCVAGFEATVKALQIMKDGSMRLWPESTEPSFQEPFLIPAAVGGDKPVERSEIQIWGLVVGSTRKQQRKKFPDED